MTAMRNVVNIAGLFCKVIARYEAIPSLRVTRRGVASRRSKAIPYSINVIAKRCEPQSKAIPYSMNVIARHKAKQSQPTTSLPGVARYEAKQSHHCELRGEELRAMSKQSHSTNVIARSCEVRSKAVSYS